MVLPPDTLVVVNDAPRRMLTRDLALWLTDLEAWPRTLFIDAGERDSACQYNAAVAVALAKPYGFFVFADSDIRPAARYMEEFWSAPADVVGCRYPTTNLHAWDNPSSIHCGLWRTSRAVLEALEPPWFLWEYNKAHTKVTRCLCHHFSHKVLIAGFSVEQAGYAMHEPRSGQASPQPLPAGAPL